MRLLINALALKGQYCGYDTVVFEILSYLRENASCSEWEITLIANSRMRDRFSDYETDFHVRYCSRWNQNYWFRGVFEQAFVPVYCLAKGIDVLYSPTNYGIIFLPKGTKQCTTFHTTQNFDLPSNLVRSKIESSLINFLSLRSLKVSHAATFVSVFTKERFMQYASHGNPDYREALERKSHLIYNGVKFSEGDVSQDYLEDRFSVTRPFAMYASSLYPFKNQLLLVKTWLGLLRSGETDLDLIIIGGIIDDEYYLQIKSLMDASLGRVRHYRNITNNELASLYRACSVYICPSQYETFGLTPLEALAHRKPVLLSDISVFREVYGVIRPSWLDLSTEAGFKDSLLQGLVAPSVDIVAADQLLEKYSFSNIVDQYVAVLSELMT